MSWWNIRGGVTHGKQQSKCSNHAVSHEISQMHGKLCNSPIITLVEVHIAIADVTSVIVEYISPTVFPIIIIC